MQTSLHDRKHNNQTQIMLLIVWWWANHSFNCQCRLLITSVVSIFAIRWYRVFLYLVKIKNKGQTIN